MHRHCTFLCWQSLTEDSCPSGSFFTQVDHLFLTNCFSKQTMNFVDFSRLMTCLLNQLAKNRLSTWVKKDPLGRESPVLKTGLQTPLQGWCTNWCGSIFDLTPGICENCIGKDHFIGEQDFFRGNIRESQLLCIKQYVYITTLFGTCVPCYSTLEQR